MADYNFKILTPITPMYGSVTQSVFTNAASTASYIRTIQLHNVTTASQVVSLFYVNASNTASITNRFFQSVMTGSGTYIIEYNQPGLMLTQSGANISGSCTDDNGVNIMIFGATE